MSEGVFEDWAAVAPIISDRVSELGWRRRELAERAQVSVADVRKIRRHTVKQRRRSRTLESLSLARGWESGHLDPVHKGRAQRAGSDNQATADAVGRWSRLDAIEGRLDEITKLVACLKADFASVIENAQRDG